MQAGHCGYQTGTKFWELVCDEQGIGGDSEYCGDNDAPLFRPKPREPKFERGQQ
jgi:hypothetical protein